MENQEKIDLQFIVSSGPKDPEKATFAFAAALAAAHSGSRVVVALTMHGAHWASDTSGTEPLVHGFPSISEMIEMLLEQGASVEACATCVDNFCPNPVGPDGHKTLSYGIQRVGLGVIAARMSDIPTTLC